LSNLIGDVVLSVIVPIYNAQPFLTDCLRSLAEQDLLNVEFLLLDDGSTDGSFAQAQQIAEVDSRFIARTFQNSGVGITRNRGIDLARGEYVAFIDPDDMLASADALRSLVETAIANQQDICGGGAAFVYPNRTDGIVPDADTQRDEAALQFHKSGIIEYNDYQFDSGFWRFIYKRDLLISNSIYFPALPRYQDPPFFCAALAAAGRFYALVKTVYLYRLPETGRPADWWTSERVQSVLSGAKLVIQIAKEHHYQKLQDLQWHRITGDLYNVILRRIEAQDSAVINQLFSLIGFAQPNPESAQRLVRMLANVKPTELIPVLNPLVSVVIPSYNVSTTLGETLDSILAQTYRNLEIIVVNDCSTDTTPELADNYAKQDGRIKVVHKPQNEDLTLARGSGFAASTGDFITFIDADDAYAPDAIETLINVYQKTNADISMAGFVITDENLVPGEPRQPNPPDATEIVVYSRDEMLDRFLRGYDAWPHNNNPDHAVCKLFRRSVLEDINWHLTDYRVGEDTFFSILTYDRIKTAAVTNRVIYHYRLQENSKSSVSNWQFQYQKQSITGLELMHSLAKQADTAFPDADQVAKGRMLQRLGSYYQEAGDMEVVRGLLAVLEEENLNSTIRIQDLELQNQQLQQQIANMYNSRTWKAGRLVLAPAKVARRIRQRKDTK